MCNAETAKHMSLEPFCGRLAAFHKANPDLAPNLYSSGFASLL